MKNRKQFRLTLFGGFRLQNADGTVLLPAARKSKALLAWLVLNPDNEHPREKIAGLLWPDSDADAARHSLRQALGGLRKIFPADNELLNTSKDFISLNSKLIDVDVQTFLQAISKGETQSLEYAVELYSGEFLEGCNPHSDMFDEWGMIYRRDFQEKVTASIDTLLTEYLKNGDFDKTIHYAMRQLTIDPLRESAYRALMQAHIQRGNQTSALRWYRRCHHVLQQELGVSPDSETEALYTKILHEYRDQQLENPPLPPAEADTGSREQQRVIYQCKMAIEGILDQVGGQSFLIRGEAGSGKAELVNKIINLAETQGFYYCIKKLSNKNNVSDTTIFRDLADSFTHCLLKTSNSRDTQQKSLCKLQDKRKRTSRQAEISTLIEKTSAYQPLLLVVEQIHHASTETLKLLAELISVAGNHSMLLVMTSRFDGEPLDPAWRGTMRGAPLTTIDLS